MKNLIIVLLGIGFMIFISCKKDATTKPDTNPSASVEFRSLTASPDTIQPGDTTSVTADANGSNLSYRWSISHGDLFGSGRTVTFGAAPCCVGNIYVTCDVSDGTHTSTKQLTILVVN